MIYRSLFFCFGLLFAESAVADNCDELSYSSAEREDVERMPASEAFQRSEGQIILMDAVGNPQPPNGLIWADILHVCRILAAFSVESNVQFEVFRVVRSDVQGVSHICFNAQNCYPLTTENLGVAMSSLARAAEQNGLLP